MRTITEYQHNADECRVLARQMAKPEDKTALADGANLGKAGPAAPTRSWAGGGTLSASWVRSVFGLLSFRC